MRVFGFTPNKNATSRAFCVFGVKALIDKHGSIFTHKDAEY